MALCAPPAPARAGEAQDPVALADPFMGVDGDGNTVPGAGVPFGFVSLSPDTAMGQSSGYDSVSAILGFSFTHVSGTGGRSKYGNFRMTPTLGDVAVNNLVFDRAEEAASPGYYRVSIGNSADSRIKVELTATRLAGMMRIRFPQGRALGNLVLDASSIIPLRGEAQQVTAVHVEPLGAQSVQGWASFAGGWNPSPYTLYFQARFDRAAASFGSWRARRGSFQLMAGTAPLDGEAQTAPASAPPDLIAEYDTGRDFARRSGSWARFDITSNPAVLVKLGVSFVSMAQAGANLDRDMQGWDFDAVREAARAQWADALGRIDIEGGTETQRRIFYSALYRGHTMPHDLTGENVWWPSREPHYEDFYTIWDSFRTLNPLLTLIEPQRERDMLRSLLDTFRATGWLPDGRIAGANGLTQGGSNADVVLGDAIVKRLGGFDTGLAWRAMVKDAETESPKPLQQGRVLQDYLKLGYVSLSQARSASRTLEYAFDDYAIALAADTLGKSAEAARYHARAGNWRNLWDDKLACIRPRYADGRWLENFRCFYLYPDRTMPWWEAPFYEGSSRQYSTFVPQDPQGLIARLGGRAAFMRWLDVLFDTGAYEQGNEPDMLAPYLYIEAGRADRTDERVRAILAGSYHLSRSGLPGNDDAGAISSWYVWSSIGLYPVAGTSRYYIGAPVFTKSVIHLEGGRHFTIAAPAASPRNMYVVGIRLNGHRLDRFVLEHAEIAKGGDLELEMAERPRLPALP